MSPLSSQTVTSHMYSNYSFLAPPRAAAPSSTACILSRAAPLTSLPHSAPTSSPSIALTLPSPGLWTPSASPLLLPDGAILALGRRPPCPPADCDKGVTLYAPGGAARWSLNTSSPVSSSPASDPRGPYIYVAESSGVVSALRTATGELVWSWRDNAASGPGIIAPLTVLPSGAACCGGVLLVGTLSGHAHALGLGDGSARWAYASEPRAGRGGISAGAWGAVGGGGAALVAGLGGFVYSVVSLTGCAVKILHPQPPTLFDPLSLP